MDASSCEKFPVIVHLPPLIYPLIYRWCGNDLVIQQDHDRIIVHTFYRRLYGTAVSLGRRFVECIGTFAVEFQCYCISGRILIGGHRCMFDISAIQHDGPVRQCELQLCRFTDLFDGFLGILCSGQFHTDPLVTFNGNDRFCQTHLVYSLFDDSLRLLHSFPQLIALEIRLRFHNDVNAALDVQSQFHPILNRFHRSNTAYGHIPSRNDNEQKHYR